MSFIISDKPFKEQSYHTPCLYAVSVIGSYEQKSHIKLRTNLCISILCEMPICNKNANYPDGRKTTPELTM